MTDEELRLKRHRLAAKITAIELRLRRLRARVAEIEALRPIGFFDIGQLDKTVPVQGLSVEGRQRLSASMVRRWETRRRLQRERETQSKGNTEGT